MNVTEFTARILLLFAPGVICSLIFDALTVHGERKPFQFLIHSFIFGAASYTTYALLWYLNSCCAQLLGDWALTVPVWPDNITILNALVDDDHEINFLEVAIAAALSAPVALAASYAHNHKFLYRAASSVKITKKFGDPDVWGYTFNSPDIIFAVVRDLPNNLVYEGWIRAFSDIESPRELSLTDAVVYKNDTGEELYSVDAIYVSRNNEDWTIEFPALEAQSNEHDQEHEENDDE